MNLVEVSELTIRAGGRNVVSNLTFTIRAGERLGLIGESGAGKSLTALAILGLLPPQFEPSGSIRLDGVELVGAPESTLAALRGGAASAVFQEPLTALDPVMRAGNQIAESISRRARRERIRMSRKEIRQEVERSLEDVAISETRRIARSFPSELSGGQQQRVALAMAIACRPKLLIADEPTTSLDATTQAEILDLFDRLVRERSMALLFISPDLPVVASIVDDAIVLKEGREVERGAIKKLLAAPTNEYTRELADAVRRLESPPDNLEDPG